MKSIDYLDQVKARHGIKSDYALAQILAVTHATVSHYRHGKSVMDSTTAVKVAELLAINPLVVIAAAELERTHKDKVRQVWLRYAAGLVVLVSLGGAPGEGNARILHNSNSDGAPLPFSSSNQGAKYTFCDKRRLNASKCPRRRARRAAGDIARLRRPVTPPRH